MTKNPTPQPGDRVRVTRTTVTHPEVEVFEGYWTGVDQPTESGHHAIDTDDGTWMRVRDQGPRTFGTSNGGAYTEIDTIEVLETRDGAPHEHLLDSYVPPQPTLSPALVAARRRVNIATGAFVAISVVVGMIVLYFFLGDLRAEVGRLNAALVLIFGLAVLPATPLAIYAHRVDRAVKAEMSQ